MENVKSFFISVFFSCFLFGCGLITKIDKLETMEEPARRKIIDAVSELKANSVIPLAAYPFQRLKGNGIIKFDGESYKGRLDFRLKKDEFKKFWLDISDPLMGFKLARLIITNDSIQGYANILNKYIDAPFSRLNELEIPINVEDIINIVSGEVIEWPENIMTANMDFTREKWFLNFPFKRERYSGELSLEFNSDYNHELLRQKLVLSKESLVIEIKYHIDGSWDLIVSTRQGNGKLEFLSKSKKYQEALKFPFNIPPNHARLDF